MKMVVLLIDRHKQEVFGENVHMAGPRLHPLVSRVAVPVEEGELSW